MIKNYNVKFAFNLPIEIRLQKRLKRIAGLFGLMSTRQAIK